MKSTGFKTVPQSCNIKALKADGAFSSQCYEDLLKTNQSIRMDAHIVHLNMRQKFTQLLILEVGTAFV